MMNYLANKTINQLNKIFKFFFIRKQSFEIIDTEELSIDDKIAHGHAPTDDYLTFYAILFYLQLKIGYKNKKAADLGCGQGSARLILKMFPFSEVYCVELSKMLIDKAKFNITDPRFTFLNENVLDTHQYLDATVFYLFNPFPEAVLVEVLSKLEDRKDIVVIYRNLKFTELHFLDRGFKKLFHLNFSYTSYVVFSK